VTDHTLARADEVLTELVELVETARTVPMSASCVVPRERTLDLLDALREVLPPEIVQARRIVAEADRLIGEATERAARLQETGAAEAAAALAQARAEAHRLEEEGRAEHARLVSATTVHQAAQAEASGLVAEARRQAESIRDSAESAAARLTGDARDYAETTLTELAAQLRKLAGTADNGRAALGGPPPD
jgi:cell division septum initiation protein DivIVA